MQKFFLFLCCVFVCVCVCVSAIMEVELDDGGKYDKTTDGGN